MQKRIKVIGVQGGSYFIEQAISSNFSDTLGGEMILSFTVKMRDLPLLSANDTLMYDGQYFVISSITRSISNGEYLISVEAEHESFVLSDEDMDFDGFTYSGSVIGALNRILSGTDMVGAIGYATDSVGFDKTGSVTRRYLLNELVSLCGGELEYSGHIVTIVKHRGQTSRYDILEKCPSADLTVTSNVQDDTVSYRLLTDGDSFVGASVGDEVRIKVGGSFAIDANVRIISISYDIYNCTGVTVQLGDYQPDITDSIIDNDERYDEIEKSLADYAKRSDVSASIDTYINSDTGRASIVSSLSGTYVTESDLDGYVDKTTLSAEIGAYIDTQAGTAKIVNNLSGTFVTEDALGSYVEKTELSAGIESYIDTAAGTAKVVSAVSGTYVTQTNLNSTLGDYAKKGDIPDLSGYVQKTELSAEIGAYIDTQAGTAKIVNNLSGTFVTEDALGNYVQKTELSAGIESYIDTAAGTAKVVSAVSGTYVTQTNLNSTLGDYAQKSDIPTLDRYLLKSELNAGIKTYIETASGKAQIVSAVSGTYVTQSNLNTTLNSYPTTSEMNSALSSYVKTTNLNSSIAQYLDTASGQAAIVSAVEGEFITESDLTGYAKVTAVTAVEQSVSSVESKISLSATYGSGTIGSNVRALLTLVSNADSSNIKIKASAIEVSGTTTFLTASDLSASGTTVIDGGRIKTGTISADRIDLNSLKVTTIYGKGSYSSYTAMTTDTTNLYVGGGSFTPSYTNVYLAAKTKVYFGSTGAFEICVDMSSDSIYSTYTASRCGIDSYPWGEIHGGGTNSYHIVIADTVVRPSAASTYSNFSLGTSTYPWNAVYTKKLYLNGTEFKGGSDSAFAGSLVTMGGSTSYYIQATTSRQLCPNTSSTSYPFYLGTSGYYWHYAYIGSVAAYIGSSSSSKLGFFGTTPVARKTVSSSADVATLITALKAYGLIY